MKKKLILIITFITIILLSLILFINIEKIQNIYKANLKNENEEKGIYLSTYSNQDNQLKVLITAKDYESGIKNMSYINQDGENIQISGNGKKQISIDYVIPQNGDYIFYAETENGERLQQTFTIDDDYKNGLLPLEITNQESNLTQNITVNVTPKDETILNNLYYKLEKETTWVSCANEINITSAQALKAGYNKDTPAVLEVKQADIAGNSIISSIELSTLDVTKPSTPNVSINILDSYPTITENGIVMNNDVTISYGDTEDIYKYYSLDNGTTWQTYTETFNTTKGALLAKSVRIQSGLESDVVSANILQGNVIGSTSLATDALGYYAYDGNFSTGIVGEIATNWYTKYLAVDSSAIGKNLSVRYLRGGTDSGAITVNFYSADGSVVSSIGFPEGNTTQTVVIPEGSTKFSISYKSQVYGWCKNVIYEIYIGS